MGSSRLRVFVAGEYCGELVEDGHGTLSFTYSKSYMGVPLSMSMPVGLARYGDRVVRPYLMGLLPDDQATRATLGALHGISGDNPFRLLSVIGLDCPGAVQICPEGVDPSQECAGGDLRELSDEEISARLAEIREDAAAAWTGSSRREGHWSLGGCQAKLALRYWDGRWYECLGTAATTHILKPGVVGYERQALVEYLSMRIARELELPVAEVSYMRFSGEEAVVIGRYDRAVLPDGSVQRIHQEDLCQALGVSPAAKYADQGGPTTPRVIELLRHTGKNAKENIYRFILYLFFNYLIGATDAHAKNHSLLHIDADDVRLAPLYDVASIAPYQSLSPRRRKPLRAALSIGGENRFGMVGLAQVKHMVATNNLLDVGLDESLLAGRLSMMAEIVPRATENVVARAKDEGIEGFDDLAPVLVGEIAANCRRTLDLLAGASRL